MKTERRIDAALADIVHAGFELNFSKGFRFTGDYLRHHHVPANVVARVINYGRQRCQEPSASLGEDVMAPVAQASSGH